MPFMSHPLGLVLSGGGVRGAAHAGVIKALEEHGIQVDCIAGTSAGAIAGVLYAKGYGGEAILQFFRETEIFQLSNFAFRKPGLMDSESYAPPLREYLGDITFESLGKQLYVATTDLVNAECRIFHSGPVLPAVIASAAVPLVFTPVEIEDGLYVDGGAIDNFPVEALLGKCEKILGVSVNPLKKMDKSALDGMFDILERVYHISTRYDTVRKAKHCDWLIQPEELVDFNIFDMGRAEEAFEIGYRAAEPVVQEMMEG
jgi:NTE family protein